MSKTNFTKVEEALVAGLRQMTITQLIEMADAMNVKKEDSSTEVAKLMSIQKTLLSAIKHKVNSLHKKDPTIYQKIGLSQKLLKKFILNPQEISAKDWELIKNTKNNLDLYIEEASKNSPLTTNEQIIEKERVKHINKRFNVNEKWLPLQ